MDRGWSITLGVGVYLLVLLLFGWYARKANREDFSDFTLASKNLPTLVILMTVAATQHSMFVTSGAVGESYRVGIEFVWAAGTWTLLQPLFYRQFGYQIWKVGTALGHETPVDLFKDRYASKGLNILVLVTLLTFIAPYIAAQTIGAGLVFSTVSDGRISFTVGSALLLAVMLVMVFLGGMRAVAWSDVLQGGVTFVLLWVAAGYVLVQSLDFPAAELFRRVAEASPRHLTIAPDAYFNSMGLMALFALGVAFQPQLWQRLLLGRSPRQNGLVSGFVGIYLSLVFIPGLLLGLAAVLLLPDLADTDAALPTLIFTSMPLWLAIPLISGVIAAGMSTVDGIMLTVSAMVTKDGGQLVSRDLAQRPEAMLRVARGAIIVLAVGAYGLALLRSDTIVALTALGWTGPLQLLPAFVGAVYWPRGTKQGAFWGMLTGLIALGMTTFVWPSPLGVPPVFWSLPLNAVVFTVVSRVTPPTDPALLRRIFVQALGRPESDLVAR